MLNIARRITRQIPKLLSRKAFFVGVLAFFIFQALWLAFSADYPMAFDEEYHVGVIRIYAEQWSPFLTAQPAGSEAFGSLLSDPSYLFHYLFSFPYRLMTIFTASEAAQVIVLRILNITLFAAALAVFRKIMLRTLSPALAHAALALMVLIPVVPFLAAHVNYDNAIVLLVAVLILLTVRILDGMRAGLLDSKQMMLFISLAALGSLVKYTILPIVAAVGLFLVLYFVRHWHKRWAEAGQAIARSWQQMTRHVKVGLCLLLLLSAGLFLQKYGTNLVRYGSPIPECHAVLSQEQCMSFGPYGRNHRLAASKGYVDPNPIKYAAVWVRDLTQRLFFTLGGRDTDYATRKPLPLPIIAGSLVVVGGIVCLVLRPRILREPEMALFATIAVTYCGALFLLDNYPQYLETGQPVAINGRYLIPLIPFIVVLLGRAYGSVIGARPGLKVAAVLVVALCFLQGGGVMTYILRSEPSWHWQNQAVIDINKAAQKTLAPLVVGGSEGH